MSSFCERMLTSRPSGRDRIPSESANLGWNGRDFLFECSDHEQAIKKAKAAKKSRRPTRTPKKLLTAYEQNLHKVHFLVRGAFRNGFELFSNRGRTCL